MKYAAGTDKGLLRDLNEDSYIIVPGCSGASCAFVIADGLGGHNSGEVASRMAVEYIRDNIGAEGCFNGENTSGKLEALVKKVNTAVYERSLGSAEVSGMGTTLTIAVVAGSEPSRRHMWGQQALSVGTDHKPAYGRPFVYRRTYQERHADKGRG